MSKVFIAVPTAEFARQAIFYDYYNLLKKPEGTICAFAHGQSPARNRNVLIEQALAHDCSHVFFLDDDLTFAPDILEKLLAHDKDIVSGYYLMRSYPHKPILFSVVLPDGRCRTAYPVDGVEPGLIPMVANGLGCCLINTQVFKDMQKPWIRLGEMEKDHWGDDIGFFHRVRQEAPHVEMFTDLSVTCGHMAVAAVWPIYQDGKWHVCYDTQGPGRLAFPAIRHEYPEEKATVTRVFMQHLEQLGRSLAHTQCCRCLWLP